MSRFKDAVAADIKAVFINGLGSQTNDINGETVMAVVDGDIIQEAQLQQLFRIPGGCFHRQIMVFVSGR